MGLLPDSKVNYTDFTSLSQLRIDARDNSQAALQKVAKQFESVFVQMMIKSMREASVPLEDDMFNTQQSKTYTDMYDKQLGLELTKKDGIGLADIIVRQLTKPGETVASDSAESTVINNRQITARNNSMVYSSSVDNNVNRFPVIRALRENYQLNVEQIEQSPHWSTPEDFIRDSWPHAKQAGEALGIDPKIILAQSALETGWGKKIHSTSEGENSYSLFGIKADHRWQGKTVAFKTVEYRNGQFSRETANFRAYDSVADSYRDYVDFLQNSSRYSEVINAESSSEYSQALQKAGYATDPKYADKLKKISDSELMNNTLSSLKFLSTEPLT